MLSHVYPHVHPMNILGGHCFDIFDRLLVLDLDSFYGLTNYLC